MTLTRTFGMSDAEWKQAQEKHAKEQAKAAAAAKALLMEKASAVEIEALKVNGGKVCLTCNASEKQGDYYRRTTLNCHANPPSGANGPLVPQVPISHWCRQWAPKEVADVEARPDDGRADGTVRQPAGVAESTGERVRARPSAKGGPAEPDPSAGAA